MSTTYHKKQKASRAREHRETKTVRNRIRRGKLPRLLSRKVSGLFGGRRVEFVA